MNRFSSIVLTAALLAALPGVAAAQDSGAEETTIDNAPAWVRNTADRAVAVFFTGATITSAQLDVEGPLPTFEFAGTAEGDQGFEIDIWPDGTLEEIEAIVAADAVPANVAAIFAAQFPEFQIETIEMSTRPGKNGLYDVWYEYAGLDAGADLDVEINEAGTVMVVELPAAA